MAERPPALFLTCEHGGNEIPPEYKELFHDLADLLDSHRGWDPGALSLAEKLSETLSAPLLAAKTSRLLVDLNRSPTNSRVFWAPTRFLGREEKQQIIEKYHRPFREEARHRISQLIRKRGRLIHLSIHSFTPELDGLLRNADAAVLYDPRRPWEKLLAVSLQRKMKEIDPGIRVRRNYPYRGIDDGHTASLRKVFPDDQYAGIEIELNHGVYLDDWDRWLRLEDAVTEAIGRVSSGS